MWNMFYSEMIARQVRIGSLWLSAEFIFMEHVSLCVSQKMSLSGMMITACCATVTGRTAALMTLICLSWTRVSFFTPSRGSGKTSAARMILRTEWCVRRVSSPSLDYDNYTYLVFYYALYLFYIFIQITTKFEVFFVCIVSYYFFTFTLFPF